MADTMRAWRSTSLARTIGEIEAELDLAWARLLSELDVAPGSPDETALSWLVVENPAEHDWRIIDAALDRLTCTECGSTLTKGPATCQRCTYHHGLRFAAREVDRPNVPAGNEHAIRVSFAVARNRTRYSARTSRLRTRPARSRRRQPAHYETSPGSKSLDQQTDTRGMRAGRHLHRRRGTHTDPLTSHHKAKMPGLRTCLTDQYQDVGDTSG
ncbi:hypothetical protein ABZ570_33090 [Micromonospora sp. NPDC007271]|uniref:hypothetical protein n=1 Tax=Micromonospora sp. NPDC007271 TaxID=3154587 RepID=UPI003405968A